jgi:hypothetical protein
MYGVGPQLPGQANHAREGVAYPFGFKIVKRDISGYFLQIGTDRLDQSQMVLKARAIQMSQKRHNDSLGPSPAEGRHEKQDSSAR